MVKRNIKIPLLVMNKSGSKEAIKLYNCIIKTLKEKNNPYFTYLEGKYNLYYNNSVYIFYTLEEIIKIIDACVVIESDYAKEIVGIVDYLLNVGKDILCFPNSIYNKKAYFSNNLIRDGAICLTSEYMLEEYLTS